VGVAIDSSGNVWVANNGSANVSKIVFISQPQLKVPLVLNIT
jgi:DNA-binding beta-propeller fold protein YncE